MEAKSLIPWGFASIAWRFILRAGTAVATVAGAARRASNKRYVLDGIDRFWEGRFITRKFGEQDSRVRKKMCKRRLDPINPNEFYHPVVIDFVLIYKCVEVKAGDRHVGKMFKLTLNRLQFYIFPDYNKCEDPEKR